MQAYISRLFSQGHHTRQCIYKLLPLPLDSVPFHQNTEHITRYFAAQFPFHLAVHAVSPVTTPPPAYTQLHLHEDSDEINIILSQDKLVYRIQLGADEYTVDNNSCIWIPRGMLHAANVVSGSGYFITLRTN